MTRTKLVVLVLMAAACGKKGGGASAPSIAKADADAANAAVPADLKSKIEFDVRKLDDGMKHHPTKYTFVAPKQWKNGFMPLKKPPLSSALSDANILPSCVQPFGAATV